MPGHLSPISVESLLSLCPVSVRPDPTVSPTTLLACRHQVSKRANPITGAVSLPAGAYGMAVLCAARNGRLEHDLGGSVDDPAAAYASGVTTRLDDCRPPSSLSSGLLAVSL
jgi:hypothetical protein